jgi:hypothetical protein
MGYSTASDVGNLINMAFSATSTPTQTQVEEFISRADAYIDSFSGHNWQGVNTVTQEYHDGVGYGPRAGMILLKKHPVISITSVEYYSGTEWKNDTAEGKPNEYPTMQTYSAYLEEGKIVFSRLRLDGHKLYRVTYTWGYTSTPVFIKDLSSTLAALGVLAFLTGYSLERYNLGDLHAMYPKEGPYGNLWRMLVNRAQDLKYQLAARRPIAGVG